MEPAKQIVLNRWDSANTDAIHSGHLLTEPRCWAVLDYASIQSPDVKGDFSLKATRDGIVHGWLVWFDAELMEGIGFSNKPGRAGPAPAKFTDVYGRAFFPLLEPVPIAEGDAVKLAIQARLLDDEYVWEWRTRILSRDNPKNVKADFSQSTAFEGALDARRLAEQIAERRPVPGQAGAIDLFILTKMDGRATVDQIGRQLQERFPDRFEELHEALIYIHELAQHYQ
jgi:protein arginine N-methyltransferase 1